MTSQNLEEKAEAENSSLAEKIPKTSNPGVAFGSKKKIKIVMNESKFCRDSITIQSKSVRECSIKGEHKRQTRTR